MSSAVEGFLEWLKGQGTEPTDAHRAMATRLLGSARADLIPRPRDMARSIARAESEGASLDELVWLQKTGDLIERYRRMTDTRASFPSPPSVSESPPAREPAAAVTPGWIWAVGGALALVAVYLAVGVAAKSLRLAEPAPTRIAQPPRSWLEANEIYVVADPLGFPAMNEAIAKKGYGRLVPEDMQLAPRIEPWREGDSSTPAILVFRRGEDVPAGVPYFAVSPRRMLQVVSNTEGIEAVVVDHRVALRKSEVQAALPRAKGGADRGLTILVNAP